MNRLVNLWEQWQDGELEDDDYRAKMLEVLNEVRVRAGERQVRKQAKRRAFKQKLRDAVRQVYEDNGGRVWPEEV